MTSFRYRMAEQAEVVAAPRNLKPKPLALSLLGVVVLAAASGAVALWRRL
jgi:hypothetical protein